MKFSIRDLLLVTVIVALVMGWWVDRRRLEARIWKLEEPERISLYLQSLDRDLSTGSPPAPEWLVRMLKSSAPAPNQPKD
jgi:hypothetical protein